MDYDDSDDGDSDYDDDSDVGIIEDYDDIHIGDSDDDNSDVGSIGDYDDSDDGDSSWKWKQRCITDDGVDDCKYENDPGSDNILYSNHLNL